MVRFELRHVHKGFDIVSYDTVVANVFAAVISAVTAAGQYPAENIDDTGQSVAFCASPFL